jgi:hypothetical protein
MRSNVERNFWRSSLLWDMIVSCCMLRWGVESNYAGAPYDVLVGADVVAPPYDLVVLARTLHALSGPQTRAYFSGKARLTGPHVAFEGEMARLFVGVSRVDGPRSWLRSPGVSISCHMDGETAARLQWVTVVATRGDATTIRVKHEGGRMRGKVQPADALRGGVTMRGDGITSRDKREGGAMRGEVTTSRRVERRWRRQSEATTSWDKWEGGTSRGNVITSLHVKRQWRE